MGVRGLTTFINYNSRKFLEDFKLHNCDIVVDGNCLATVLFYNSITITASFGGDYDKYANAVENFFNELLKCSLNPIVIFDGGYEKKKLSTVYSRNKSKVISLSNIGPTNHSKVCFPLMMRQVFRDKLKEMGISFAQSDFEADQEIAALARKLQCPVVSNDSDFFIYDVNLIPLTDFPLEADKDSNGQYFMKCLVYKVEKFLHSLGGLPKSHLPLLAALLGNDYISKSTFANFYSQMNITRGKKQKQIHFRVEAIISWLKKRSFDSALKEILGHLKKNRKQQVAAKLAKIIQGYSQVSTPLDAYLMKDVEDYSDIEIISVKAIMKQYDIVDESLEVTEPEPDSQENESSSDSENNEEGCDRSQLNSSDDFDCITSRADPLNFKELSVNAKNIPPWLIDYSREGNLPSCIMTLISLKIYFCVPQVEDYETCHAGMIGLPVISKIAGILLGEVNYLYYYRSNKCNYICSHVPTSTVCNEKKLPSVLTLCQLTHSQRKSLLFDIFEINSDFLNVIENFPEKWHTFIISIVYWARNIKEIKFQSYLFHSISIMIICIRVVESKIGYFRNKRPFMQRYASKIKKIEGVTKLVIGESDSIDRIIESIPLEECLTVFEIFLPYFQIEEKLKTNSKFFSKATIHSFAQLQVCIDLAYTLNSLLKMPYESLPIYNFFNSTFLYNFCTNFKKRSNIEAYCETLLVHCPAVLHLHKTIVRHFNKFVAVQQISTITKKRKKKKKTTSKQVDSSLTHSDSDNEISAYSDEDNAFSLLSKLSIQ